MKKLKPNIPTLSPILFRNNFIQNKTDELLNHENITQFFIHSFKEDAVHLNLPLPPHKNTVNEFVFITNGTMKKNLGIESFQLNKNDFLFTPKNNIASTEYMSEDLEGFYCHFSDEFVGANPFLETLKTQISNQNYLHIPQEEVDNLVFLLTRIVKLYKNSNQNPNDFRLLSFYLSTVIAELFLTFVKQESSAKQNSAILSKFKKLVNKQFKKNLDISEYASQLTITPNHLNKIVKNETGKTASQIITEITVLEAKVLLLQTKMTINEISMELGFTDASYFSRFFKNSNNNSPSNYRKMIDLC
ncbi:helix-turn-helix domain-containing protein [Flavobacterium ardleyense]|uniref:Helix-turn-helix domain-containing protein n=1 Tax=Flavobacterium ardleyense TaxID=2038737 RepID=A0ABW5Z997_9FLAO